MPSHIRSFRNLLNRFRRNGGGSTVVEFALVAPIFFALLFAIIETAIVFFASQVLETITQNSARMILTGQAQQASYTQAQFAAYVCTQVPTLFDACRAAARNNPAASGCAPAHASVGRSLCSTAAACASITSRGAPDAESAAGRSA